MVGLLLNIVNENRIVAAAIAILILVLTAGTCGYFLIRRYLKYRKELNEKLKELKEKEEAEEKAEKEAKEQMNEKSDKVHGPGKSVKSEEKLDAPVKKDAIDSDAAQVPEPKEGKNNKGKEEGVVSQEEITKTEELEQSEKVVEIQEKVVDKTEKVDKKEGE